MGAMIEEALSRFSGYTASDSRSKQSKASEGNWSEWVGSYERKQSLKYVGYRPHRALMVSISTLN